MCEEAELLEQRVGPLQRILSGSAQILTSTLSVSLLGLINNILFAHYLGIEEYGIALTAVATVGLLSGWAGFGAESFLGADIARELGEGHHGAARRLLRNYVALRLATTAGLAFGLLTVGRIFLTGTFSDLSPELLPGITLLVVGQSLASTHKVAFLAYQQFGRVARLTVSEALVRTVIVIVLPFISWRSASFAVMAYGASSLLTAALFSPRLWVLLTQRVGDGGEGLRFTEALRRHGKWSILLSATKGTGDALPNLVLASVAGTEFVAIYHVAASYIAVLQIPINSIAQVLGPVIANELDSAQLIAVRVTKYGVLLALPLGLCGALLGQWLIPILFSGSFLSSVTVAVILAPVIVSGALRTSQRALLYALRRQDLALSSYAIAFLFDIVLSAVMAWKWGVVGFAVARMAASFFIFMVREHQLRGLGKGLPTTEVIHLDEFDRNLLRRLVARFI